MTKLDNGTWLSSSTQPSLMAIMLESLAVSGTERVLEVGTGTGYNAALLSAGLGSSQVTSVDIDAKGQSSTLGIGVTHYVRRSGIRVVIKVPPAHCF